MGPVATARSSFLTLPHWMIYVAYLMCLLLSVFCVIITLLYGQAFGLQLALKWLLAFFMAFLASFIIIEPAKVCILWKDVLEKSYVQRTDYGLHEEPGVVGMG